MNRRRSNTVSTVLAALGFLLACAAESALAGTRPPTRSSGRSPSAQTNRSVTARRTASSTASASRRRQPSRAAAVRSTPQVTRRQPSRAPQVTRREPSRTTVVRTAPQVNRSVVRSATRSNPRSGLSRTPSSSRSPAIRTHVRSVPSANINVPARRTPGGPTVIHRTTQHRKTTYIRHEHRPGWARRPPAPRTLVSTGRFCPPAYTPAVACIRPAPVRGYYGSTYERLYGPEFHDAFFRSYPSSIIVTQTPEQILQPIYVPVETTPIVETDTEPMLESSPYPVMDVPSEPLIETGTEPLPMPETLEAPGSQVPPLTDLPPDAPATFLEQGEEAFAMGRYDEARRLVRRAVIGLPDDPYAQLDYGLVHFALGEYQIAAQAFRRALAGDPDLLDRMPNVATAYGVPGDFDRHLAALKDRVFHEPTDTHARFLYGLVLVSSGDPESAVSHLSRVLHQDPRDTMAYLLRDATLRALHTERLGRGAVVVPDAP